MRLVALLLLGAALPAPLPAAQPQSAVAATAGSLPPNAFTTGPVRADALEFTKLLMPEDLFLQMLERVLVAGIEQGAEESGGLDPRLLDVLRKELPPIVREHERQAMPETYNRYARAIGAHFSSSELAQLETFYRTTTGQKIIVGKFAGVDVSGMLRKWSDDPDAEVTGSDIESINRGAVSRMIPHFNEADKNALLGFMEQPVFKRLTAFNATMIALEAQIAGESDPALDAKIDAVVESVLQRFPPESPTS